MSRALPRCCSICSLLRMAAANSVLSAGGTFSLRVALSFFHRSCVIFRAPVTFLQNHPVFDSRTTSQQVNTCISCAVHTLALTYTPDALSFGVRLA